MEEFDAAWGEVEKGLRDSFRAGRERKRGQRLENTGANAQRQMQMIRQRQSQAPKAAPSKRTATRRTVSSPPTPTPTPPVRRPSPLGGPKRETVSAPPAPKTERQMWGKPEGYEGPNVDVDMDALTANRRPAGSGEMGEQGFDFFSAGRQEQPLDLGPVPTPAVVRGKTPEKDLGDRKGKVPAGYNAAKRSYKAAIDRGDITLEEATEKFGDYSDFKTKRGKYEQTPSLEESKAALSGGEQAIPVPQTGSATSQQPMQQIPADPIDTATENVEQAIDLSDGVDDPTNNEANEAGWKAVEQEVAPPPAPPAPPAPIATPASQVPAISTPVNDGFNEALNQQFSEANRDVRNLTDEFGAEPGEPEPPAPVADTPVEVETERPTSVADTPVEAPKPNPTEGLPKADSKAKETAAEIQPSKAVSQAASKKIASEGVSYGDYSKHIQAAAQGSEASLDFLRNNPDAVKQFNPKGLPKRIQDNMGGEAPAKKAPAKAKPKPKPKPKPKKTDLDEATENFIDQIVPKKTTTKTVASGSQPNNPQKKSETTGQYGTFTGKKPDLNKSLDWSDLAFLRPDSPSVQFLNDREGRPSIAQSIDNHEVTGSFARPETMSVKDLHRLISNMPKHHQTGNNVPLEFDPSRLMDNKGTPLMVKPPGPTGNDRFLHSNTGLSRMKANAGKSLMNTWNVDGRIFNENKGTPMELSFKDLLSATGLKSKNRNPFGKIKNPPTQLGRPVHYIGVNHNKEYPLSLGDSRGKLGYEMSIDGNRGMHEISITNKPTRPMMPANLQNMNENVKGLPKNVEMSIAELASRIKTATGKDANEYANFNESGMDKTKLKRLLASLLTQPNKDETVTISAGNTPALDGDSYSVPMQAQMLGGDILDESGKRNLLTFTQAPRDLRQTEESWKDKRPENILE